MSLMGADAAADRRRGGRVVVGVPVQPLPDDRGRHQRRAAQRDRRAPARPAPRPRTREPAEDRPRDPGLAGSGRSALDEALGAGRDRDRRPRICRQADAGHRPDCRRSRCTAWLNHVQDDMRERPRPGIEYLRAEQSRLESQQHLLAELLTSNATVTRRRRRRADRRGGSARLGAGGAGVDQ